MKDYTAAIKFISPDAEFSLWDEDLNTLIWHNEAIPQPTINEIEAGWIAYKTKLENDKQDAEAKRLATLTKLQALGLDEDDLKALGL